MHAKLSYMLQHMSTGGGRNFTVDSHFEQFCIYNVQYIEWTSLSTNFMNNKECLHFGQLLWPSSGLKYISFLLFTLKKARAAGRNVGNHYCS